jgi:hypothetical protein
VRRYKMRTPRKSAPSIIYFMSVWREGKRKPYVIAECAVAGCRSTAVWGHSDASIRAALATLTTICDCPSRYHKCMERQGYRLYKA